MKWQHCKLQKNRVSFLGAAGVFDNKADVYLNDQAAVSKLEEDGWELVNVLLDPEGAFIYFFKRPAPDKSGRAKKQPQAV